MALFFARPLPCAAGCQVPGSGLEAPFRWQGFHGCSLLDGSVQQELSLGPGGCYHSQEKKKLLKINFFFSSPHHGTDNLDLLSPAPP